jgi:hypothetical protein
MKRAGFLPRQRATPRRKAPERVPHARLKPKASAPPTAEQERFHASLRGLPCQCGCGRPGECTHHLLASAPGKVGRRDHWFVVRLSNHCHNGARLSVHGLGSEARFQRETGAADLAAVAAANLARWRAA